MEYQELIARLQKAEERARKLASLTNMNECSWKRLYASAREDRVRWEAYCQEKGYATSYNYGDVIC